jgi:hypothetical protein
MTCPQPIADAVLAIIRQSILRARAAGWDGDAGLCAVLMDHIHNLPGLLTDYSEERLDYYWDTERLSFIDRVPVAISDSFMPLWEKLQKSGSLTETTANNT